MRNRNLSTIGYIMDHLGIRTTEMARELHVDPSLISKFRSGARRLSSRSVYFDEICDYIIESSRSEPDRLNNVLKDLFPKQEISDVIQTRIYLKMALNEKILGKDVKGSMFFSNAKTMPVMNYDKIKGRRECIDNLLDYAGSLDSPCEMIFIDTDAFHWLWTDAEFSQAFCKKLITLLDKGFRAVFAIRYSSLREDFYRFFDSCNEIIFHKNATWYHVQYYDVPIIGISLTLINHSISVVGMFAHGDSMQTMIFRDPSVVLEHNDFAKSFISNCIPLFDEIRPEEMPDVITTSEGLQRRNTFFAFLPVFAFIQADTGLLNDILESNGVLKDSTSYKNVMKVNSFFKELTGIHLNDELCGNNEIVFIFQIEKLIERIHNRKFISSSLSCICGKNIVINASQHAAELRYLAEVLEKNHNLKIILSSKDDGIDLPSINCWCMKNRYMMQMNDNGFRVCEENTIVSIASNAFERCIHAAPPRRSQPEEVKQMLLYYAYALEC